MSFCCNRTKGGRLGGFFNQERIVVAGRFELPRINSSFILLVS